MPRRQGQVDRADDLASLSRPALEALALERGLPGFSSRWKSETIIRKLEALANGKT